MTVGVGFELLFGFTHNNTGFAFNIDEKITTTQGRAESGSATAEHTKGFVLSEDVGNDLTVDVLREPIKKINKKGEKYYVAWDKDSEEYEDGNMSQGMVGEGTIKEKDHYTNFIFYTKAGATSCPYEDEVRTQYYKANEGGVVISEKTIQIEQPGVIIAPKTMVNVPSGNSANFKITLYNKSGFNADLGAILKIDDESTKTGAKFYIDGAPIGNGRFFNIPAGNTIEKTLEVQRGAVMEYDDMKLILQSECDDALADTMVFSVHFTPSCSDVRVRKPSDQWVYNTRLDTMTVDVTPEKYMNVVLDNFDVNYDRFRHIELQRKTSAESDEDWTTIMNFYANDSIMEHDRAEGKNVDMIRESDRGSIYYKMFMDDKMDQRYDLRAVSVCPINATTTATVISDVVSGIKDTYRPRLFGSAQPANGILTIEDDARLNFNEAIADGLLTLDNFQVTGIRNGSKADNTTSITLDGQDDHLATEFDKNMSSKDITMEVWAWSENGDQDATFFSHGNINESMELGITADKHLTAKVGDLKYRSDNPVPFEAGSWSHVALTYDKSGHITAYYNYEPYINADAPAYNSTGHIEVGKSISANSGNYEGRVRDFRVWNDVLSVSDFKALSEVTLSGDEPNLVGYYPMDEGKGDYTEDKARGANLTFKGGAWTTPEGISVHFDGMNDYLDLNASSFAITDEADYTAEFWFKAEPGQVNATMFCNGAADGNDFGGSLSRVAVGFDDAGKLCFKNNGQTITVDKELRDNNWHHFAVSVSRTNNRGQIYVDGELMNYFNAQNIGGVEGSSMYLGARVWKPSMTEQIADNFFSGYIDDFRFWNLYKNKDIVSQNNNKKLEGNEIGLVHYYPFEEYQSYSGLQYLVFTNKDKHISRTVNPDTDEFAIVGTTESSLQSSDAAPIKNRGAVANLDFDFVVNNDALIINLKEDEASIAKTIVTFSVYDVRDLNGNSIASPITWSAYIDRNQLKWSETGLTLSKPVYDEMTFVVKAVNKGGAVQNFTIENLPSWLTAKPAVGTIAPASSQDIVFTVDAGLNVGTYSEVVNIVNNDGVPEALDITLTVLGEQPDWEVNKSDYEYSMNIFGQLNFNGIYSSDKRDIIAAFDAKGNCVGKANSYYDEKFDMWYALLTIYGNDSQYDGLTFRTWDASTGITYAATPSQAIRFANNEIIGDVENPVIFNGRQECYRTLNLEKGWNWISFNLASDKMNDANVLLNTGEIWSSDDILKNFDSQTSYSSKLGKWESVKLLNETSYKMKVAQAHKLTVSGSPVDVAKTKITVNGNAWNYIGYLPSVNHTVKEALAGYDAQPGDVVKSQTGFAMYSKNEWVG
ncbi:MAG: LamG domain-containing protein, partial [Paludibacteraceae bacterium]|nr:LamG domain-containing protein [Paludibacteraceae bacterium]